MFFLKKYKMTLQVSSRQETLTSSSRGRRPTSNNNYGDWSIK